MAKTNPQYEKVIAALKASGSKREGNDWQCPCHDDTKPSLGVEPGDKVPVVFAHMPKDAPDCTPKKIVAALGLQWSEISGKPKEKRTVYEYHDRDGNPLVDVIRIDKPDGSKRFLQFKAGHRKIGEDRAGSVDGMPNTLWLWPEVDQQVKLGGDVWVVEGEKSVLAIRKLDEVATTIRGGSNSKTGWMPAHSEALRGASVVNVVADNDLAGWLFARSIAVALRRAEIAYKVWRPATDGKKDDVVEHLDAGFALSELRPLTSNEIKARFEEAKLRGEISGDNDKVWPKSSQPYSVAEQFVREFKTNDGLPILKRWRSRFYEWTGTHYERVSDEDLRKQLYEALDKAKCEGADDGLMDWTPTKGKIDAVVDALKAFTLLPDDTEDGIEGIIAFSNGNLNVATREMSVATPALFNLSSRPYEFDPSAASPVRWLRFLHQIWKDDNESIEQLQEWAGYLISEQNGYQKYLQFIGPPASGKSTIAGVLTDLVGPANVVAQPLHAIAGRFGLVPYIGKTLAIPGDVRLSGAKDHAQVVNALLQIVGNDRVNIEFKNANEWWEGHLRTRFMIASNELPALRDEGGGLARRMLLLETNESFEHRMDINLGKKLRNELPGIVLWALQGLDRLNARGGFAFVESSRETLAAAKDIGRPVLRFCEAKVIKCEDNGSVRMTLPEAYDAFVQWCVEEGITYPGERQGFGAKLKTTLRARTSRVKIKNVSTVVYHDAKLISNKQSV